MLKVKNIFFCDKRNVLYKKKNINKLFLLHKFFVLHCYIGKMSYLKKLKN